MIKTSEPIILVESVQEAVKFYTEKLLFDLVDVQIDEAGRDLIAASLKKGKSVVHFREPKVEEQAEFSFIKRCPNRCIALYIELKNGLDTYFQRCSKKKEVIVVHKPEASPHGYRSFTLKDPFGLTLVFAEPQAGRSKGAANLGIGIKVAQSDITQYQQGSDQPVLAMITQLKAFGILRRAAKKFAKLYFKSKTPKVKKS